MSAQGERVPIPKVKFTEEEDNKLRKIIEEHSPSNWRLIAKLMQNRTSRQCRERWTNYINPALSTCPWTKAEDTLLVQKYQEFGSRWHDIVKYFPNRSKNNLKNRIIYLKKHPGKMKIKAKVQKAEEVIEPAPKEEKSPQKESDPFGFFDNVISPFDLLEFAFGQSSKCVDISFYYL